MASVFIRPCLEKCAAGDVSADAFFCGAAHHAADSAVCALFLGSRMTRVPGMPAASSATGLPAEREANSSASGPVPPTIRTSRTPPSMARLAASSFRYHSTRNDTALHQPLDFLAADHRKHLLAVEHAGNVRQVNQLVGAQIFRARRGHVIGIDIVELVVRAKTEARRDRHEFFAPQRFDESRIDCR